MRQTVYQISNWAPFALLVVFTLGVLFSLSLHAQDSYGEQEQTVKLAVMENQIKDLSDLGPQVQTLKMHVQESDAVMRQVKDEVDAIFSVAKWIAFGVFGLIGMQGWKKLYPGTEDQRSSILSIKDK